MKDIPLRRAAFDPLFAPTNWNRTRAIPILWLRILRAPPWSTAVAVQVNAAHFPSYRLTEPPMALSTIAALGAVLTAAVAFMTVRKVRQSRKVFYFHDEG